MSLLEKVIKLTKAQYNTLSADGTVGPLTGINDNYLYFITDETLSSTDLGENFLLNVQYGGTGKTSFTTGSLLVGNGTHALTEIGATDLNTPNTIVKRNSDGDFNARKVTLTEAKIGSITIASNKLTAVTSIDTNDSNGLLAYKPASWTGVSNNQWGVGTINVQGVIRSSNTDLLHSRNGTSSVILDTGNYSSYSAYSLRCADRPSTPNSAHESTNYGKIYTFLSSSSMDSSGLKPKFTSDTDAPSTHDGYILDFHWDNNGLWNTLLALTNGTNAISIRGNPNDSWTDWIPVLTKNNIGSGDANGQIKVAGSNISVTGLKALAYKDTLVAADIPNLSWDKITSDKPTTLSGYGITDAAANSHSHTLKIGNKSLSVSTSELTWALHDILKTSTSIGTNTSWDLYDPGVYYVSSSGAFTGTNNPENTNTNNGIAPYHYGLLIVSRAGDGGVAEFYISHNDSNSASYGIHYRTGWNNTYVAKWSVLLDSHNYTNYTVTKTGTGASGSWGISITGSSASCTGNAATASKISAKLETTTKTYLLGTSTAITATAANVDLTGDTGVYLTTTAGALSAKEYCINDGTNEKVILQWNGSDESLDFVFA